MRDYNLGGFKTSCLGASPSTSAATTAAVAAASSETGIPAAPIMSAISLATGGYKCPKQIISLVTSILLAVLTLATGFPFSLLMVALNNYLTCPVGRKKLSNAMKTCTVANGVLVPFKSLMAIQDQGNLHSGTLTNTWNTVCELATNYIALGAVVEVAVAQALVDLNVMTLDGNGNLSYTGNSGNPIIVNALSGPFINQNLVQGQTGFPTLPIMKYLTAIQNLQAGKAGMGSIAATGMEIETWSASLGENNQGLLVFNTAYAGGACPAPNTPAQCQPQWNALTYADQAIVSYVKNAFNTAATGIYYEEADNIALNSNLNTFIADSNVAQLVGIFNNCLTGVAITAVQEIAPSSVLSTGNANVLASLGLSTLTLANSWPYVMGAGVLGAWYYRERS